MAADIVKVIFFPYDAEGHNPYQRQLAEALARRGVQVTGARPTSLILWRQFRTVRSAGVLHIHWPESHVLSASSRTITLLRMSAMAVQLGLLRAAGKRIVCTLHNLRPHDNPFPRLMDGYLRLLYRLAHGLIAHCPRAAELSATTYGIKTAGKIRVIPHGHYIDWYPNQLTQEEARERLGLPASACVLLFFGALRRYKAVSDLVSAFRARPAADAILVIAGQPADEATDRQLRVAMGGDPAIVYRPGFVAPDEVQLFMNASDFVVCPQPEALTSGSLILGMSFGRACIAPDVGCLGQSLDASGGIVYDPSRPQALAEALDRALAGRAEAAKMGAHNLDKARSWDWDAIARSTLAIYADDSRGPV